MPLHPLHPVSRDQPAKLNCLKVGQRIQKEKLKILGTGFTVIPLTSGRYLVQSVPGEMSLDQLSVLDQAEKHRGLVTEDSLVTNLRWDQQRSLLVLGEHIRSLSALSSNFFLSERMVGAGQLWVDSQAEGGESQYWVPSIFSSNF